jgi:Flp pilus assembly secretin CpaC
VRSCERFGHVALLAIVGACFFPIASVAADADIHANVISDDFTSRSNVISDDSTSRFVSLVLGKSMVIDLPVDAVDVMIGDTKIANAVMRTSRRAYVVATGLGQTNAYFFDNKGREIEALNINVSKTSRMLQSVAAMQISVFRGPEETIYNCQPVCVPNQEAAPAPPSAPPTIIYNIQQPQPQPK